MSSRSARRAESNLKRRREDYDAMRRPDKDQVFTRPGSQNPHKSVRPKGKKR